MFLLLNRVKRVFLISIWNREQKKNESHELINASKTENREIKSRGIPRLDAEFVKRGSRATAKQTNEFFSFCLLILSSRVSKLFHIYTQIYTAHLINCNHRTSSPPHLKHRRQKKSFFFGFRKPPNEKCSNRIKDNQNR